MNTVKNLLVCGSLLVSSVVFSQGTETRKLSSFNKLDIGGSFEVNIEKGNEESARIIAEGVGLEKIITEVRGSTLDIRLEKGEYRNIKVKIYITYKSIDAIDKSGSGNLTCSSDLSANNFDFGLSGSGNVTGKKIKAQQVKIRKSGSGNIKLAALEADDAELSLSGSGDVEIGEGYAKTQSVHISGSGNISAHGLKSNDCTASISGSGNIDVSVSQSLEGSISGSGNIVYDGDAQVKKLGISGSGRISKR
jgi:Putative auto-transporter adhesin, head GIN domain